MPSAGKLSANKDRVVVIISLDGFPAYALDNPRLPVPTLRKLAQEGVIAESMRPVNPTVTWPNHTSLVTGVDPSEHDVLFNGLLTRFTNGRQPVVEPWRDKDILVRSPTIYDAAHEAGLTTAQVDWVAIHGAKTITWQFPEIPDINGTIEREMIADGTVTEEQLRTFEQSSQAWQDQIWTNAALRILKEHQPNLLLFHLLTVDDTNHEYGPISDASISAMALVDGHVNEVLTAIQKLDIVDRTMVIVVSDHGFRTIKHKICPNVLLRRAGLIEGVQSEAKGKAWVLSTGGTAMVYLTKPDPDGEITRKLRTILTGAEGIEQILGKEDFGQLGLPSPNSTDQAPDLVLAAAQGYMFSSDSEGDYVSTVNGGTHGYLNNDPKMQSIFLAWGAGVPHGIRLGPISNLDVAPTIAAFLGVEMKRAQGHSIEQVLGAVARK